MDLALPDRYLITPELDAEPAFLATLAETLTHSNIRLVQLRVKHATPAVYARLAEQALALCHAHRARLILNCPITNSALIEGADGIHLSSAALMACHGRPIDAGKLVSAACHSVEQLMHAQRIGADLVTLSPVLMTQSHPDATPLGWQRFADMVACWQSKQMPAPAIDARGPASTASTADAADSNDNGERPPLAIYALGGMTPEHIAQAQQCGARGIAAIRSLWSTDRAVVS